MVAVPTTRYKVNIHKTIFVQYFELRDAYNQGRPLRDRLREPHLHLFKVLAKLYYRRLSVYQALEEQLQPDAALPTMRTNNAYLARELHCSERKIRYLRDRLRDAGALVGRNWHGSSADYELGIAPEWLWIIEQPDNRNVATQFRPAGSPPLVAIVDMETGEILTESDPSATDASRKTLPVVPVTSNLFNRNTIKLNELEWLPNGDVVVAAGNRSANEEHGAPEGAPDQTAGNQNERGGAGNEESKASYRTSEEPETEGLGARPAHIPQAAPTLPPETFEVATDHLSEQERKRLFWIVDEIWKKSAKDLPWGRGWLADAVVIRAKARLAEQFCYYPQHLWKNHAKQIKRRLKLVARWIQKEKIRKGRTITLRLPDGYFDIRETDYFAKTKSWFRADAGNRQDIHHKSLLTQAINAYMATLATHETAKKSGTVYRKWQYLLRSKDPALAQAFEDQLIHFKYNNETIDYGNGNNAPSAKTA